MALGFDYDIQRLGDHSYYVTTGKFGDGHDLTLLISKPLARLGDPALPIFFNFFFALSIYFMLKPFIKYPEWAFLLAPLTPLTGVYAQIFAISLFNFMLGFYFRSKKKVAAGFLVLVFLAHFWTGIFMFFVFTLYVLIFDRNREILKWFLLPAIFVVGFFLLFMFQGMGFLAWPQTGPFGDLTATQFFALLSRGFGFFILSLFGLYKLYNFKNRGFFKINLMLFVIPLFVVFCLPTASYWNWRMFYFIPFLALTSVIFSSVFAGKDKQKA